MVASFAPDVPYQLALLLGALLLLTGLVLTLALGRRDGAAPPSHVPAARPVVVLGVAGVLVALVGGPVGLAAALALAGVLALLPSAGRPEDPDLVEWWSAGRARRRMLLALAVVAPVAAAVAVAATPWPDGRLGIESLLVQTRVARRRGLAVGRARRRPAPAEAGEPCGRRRMTGRSTSA